MPHRIPAPLTTLTATALAISALGCASMRDPKTNEFSCRWETSQFAVTFTPGPRNPESGRTFSYYTVSKKSAESRRTIESAENLDALRSYTIADPKHYIRVVEDPGSPQLLIEEDVPNDCCPCKNFIWVHENNYGFLEHRYLKLPEISKGTGGVDSEFPTVVAISRDTLTYRYSDGKDISRKLQQIESDTKPTPPG